MPMIHKTGVDHADLEHSGIYVFVYFCTICSLSCGTFYTKMGLVDFIL